VSDLDNPGQPAPHARPSSSDLLRAVCIFCDIISGFEPARIHYRDDDVIVFENVLGWVRVMLLVVPTRHMTQMEMWMDIQKYATVAAQIGEQMCPSGYRLVSNFRNKAGWLGDAHQSQDHAHIHVLGGEPLGPYVNPYKGF
jgi:histidine triad (HIT) family protein